MNSIHVKHINKTSNTHYVNDDDDDHNNNNNNHVIIITMSELTCVKE